MNDNANADFQVKTNIADLAKLVEDSLNEIYIFDTNELHFMLVNKQARENLGYSMAELANMRPMDIKPEFTDEKFTATIEPLKSGRSNKIIFETVHERKDKTHYPVEVHLQKGEFAGTEVLTAIILDITERKRAQEEHRSIEQRMLDTQKLESLGVLAGGIAHDFNNILTSIMGYADLARMSTGQDSKAHYYLEQLVKGATRGAELVKQILAYSGKGKFFIERVFVQELIKDIGELLEVSITKNCSLQYHFEDNIPAVDADATQLRQVILNLILNSSEAIGDEQGLITVRAGSLKADKEYLASAYFEDDLSEGDYVYLEVSDSGTGMDEDTVKKIFEPFFTTKFTGRGLGLSAIMGIVRGHKGTLNVYSEKGKGTTFKILLPISTSAPIVADKLVLDETLKLDTGVVLIIDDEEHVRAIATEMFLQMGFNVLTAEDGVEGLDLFKESHHSLSLVLLDMTMPRMNGAEVFRNMRQINNTVPTILSSGYNEQTMVNEFAGKGLAGFLQKPYSFENMVREVTKVLTKPPK